MPSDFFINSTRNGKEYDDLRDYVRSKLENLPGCHDWEHTKRVLRNAILISESIKNNSACVDMHVVRMAALLHDIARQDELQADGSVCHARLGADMAADILKKLNIVNVSHSAVVDCVRKHRYRNKSMPPETLEEKIIYDADKLDSLGAVGVARALHFSGRIGSVLHNTSDMALNSDAYGRQDSAYREFLVKLRYIPQKMLTKPGRFLAIERYSYMEKFFLKMNEEIYGTSTFQNS